MTKARKGFLAGAYHLRGPADNIRHYNGWASTYDEVMREYDYVAPFKAAALLAKHFSDTAAEVLDCGCGTGLGGVALLARGFQIIDGADIAEKMLDEARKKNIYRTLQQADIIAGLDAADNRYGAVQCVGTFTIGHAPPTALPELFRVTAPGGAVVFTVNETVYEKENYPRHLQEWTADKKIETIESFKDSYIAETDTGGFYIALRVL